MNRLSQEPSLYLQQHAQNPVDWWAWGHDALQTAVREEKPIILSIGYSSCHWCHVMEHESFENHEVAELMNHYYVPIKVDREERPDIDQIYMEALHLMGVRGGWPLNMFLFPDGCPFYGGTYFPKDQWIHLLLQIKDAWLKHRHELRNSAEKFRAALESNELDLSQRFKINSYQTQLAEEAFDTLSQKFDHRYGGLSKAPKFPMPSIWEFLNVYAHHNDQPAARTALKTTLEAMAQGGLYDALGGGFARYSTDSIWLVPHFEKMLYDNAQLLAVYANAYKSTKEPLYKEVIKEVALFLQTEMQDGSGAFYSSIDADSQGEEGKFYVWTESEIDIALGDKSPLFKQFYGIRPEGNWEEHKNILYQTKSAKTFALENNLDQQVWNDTLSYCKSVLLKTRNQRVRPTTDKKILTAWNSLCISALTLAYRATGEPLYWQMAAKSLHFLTSKLIENDTVFHLDSPRKEMGFLDDYATAIQALIDAYQTVFEPAYLTEAKRLAQKAIDEFYDEHDGLFFFTGKSHQSLIARKKEIFDNVIPSSNSVMARALRSLGKLVSEPNFSRLSQAMLENVVAYLPKNIEFMANWGLLYLENLYGDKEVALSGTLAKQWATIFNEQFLPGVVIAASEVESQLPLLKNRFQHGKSLIYVCQNQTCSLPTDKIEQALAEVKAMRF